MQDFDTYRDMLINHVDWIIGAWFFAAAGGTAGHQIDGATVQALKILALEAGEQL